MNTATLRQARASFLFLLFITSFARCWADTSGLLAGSELACCVESHAHEGQDQDPEETPLDCSVCVLVQSGFLPGANSLDLPSPAFVEVDVLWTDFAARLSSSEDENVLEALPFPTNREPALTTSRLVSATAVFVRGPNLG